MIDARGGWVVGVLVAAVVGLAACGSAAEARPGDRAGTSTLPSAELTGPAAGASLPSGLPSDPGATGAVPTVSAGGSLPPDVATGDLSAVVFAAGVLQYLHCAGSGSPTVVVVPDLGVSHVSWDASVQALAQHTRTCVYDRPGLGSAPPRSSPLQVVDAGLNARELGQLLGAAQQRAPYVLVGQGYGTLVARAFAHLFPERVRALVLGGAAPARPGDAVFWTEAGHRVDIAASTRAAGRVPTAGATLIVSTLPAVTPQAIATAVAALPLVTAGG